MSSRSEKGESFAPLSDELRYMFIDFNAYFASVEQYDDPLIRGRPVIVTPLASEHSGAIAASYEAKALGISRGTSVLEARRLCPHIVIRPARHDRYVEMHHLLMAEIERHLPVSRIYSIDECLCRLSRTEQDIGTARAKAIAVKRGIRSTFGSALRCSIGLASSPLLAKLASDLEKPDGLVAVPMSCLPDAFADLPLRAIPGIGHGIGARLGKAGIATFKDLWAMEPRRARAVWGSVEGERFIYGLHGHDLPMTQEPQGKRMIGHSRVLSGNDRHPDRARIVIRALLLKTASRLRHHNLHAGSMHVGIRLYPEGAITHDADFRATQNSWRLLATLDDFWGPMMRALPHRHPACLKMVTVYLSDLRPTPAEPDLFIAADEDSRDAREADLWGRIDRLNRCFGGTKVVLASHQLLDLNYLGVKIAFSRIPDRSEFV